MNRKTKRKIGLLILVAAVVFSLAGLIGCIGEEPAESFLAGKNALDQVVTYYANGGKFDGTSNLVVKDIYYPEGAYVIDDFDSVKNISIKRDDYVFNGWYYAELDGEGNPLLNESGEVVASSQKVDFSVKIQKGEHWYVCAAWVPTVKVEILLVSDDGGNVTATDDTVYQDGDLIGYRSFQTVGTSYVAVIDTTAPVKATGYTFTQYYYDRACTLPVLENISLPAGEIENNPVVYAKYIKGDWTIVRTASDVKSMLTSFTAKNYYFSNMSADKVIDCSTVSGLPLKTTGVFNSTVEGNGYTVKNLTYTVTLSMAGVDYSVFGQFGANAVVKNLTMENLTVNVTTAKSVNLYLVCGKAEEGATFENFSFVNVRMNITAEVDIYNIVTGSVYVTDNWLFGGVSDGNANTDRAFLEAFGGQIRVDGATLAVNGSILVGGDGQADGE